jgi:signal transduction histidine kinase
MRVFAFSHPHTHPPFLSSSHLPPLVSDLMNSGFTISPSTFATLFPFYLTIERDLSITNLGYGWKRMYPFLTENHKFQENFTIEDPDIPSDFDSIQFHQNSPFSIVSKHDRFKFKGRMVSIDTDRMLFIGSPVAKDIDKIERFGLRYNNLLSHDLNDDISFKMEMQSIALEEAKQAAERLAKKQLEVHRRLVEEQELSELKTRFINTASHEFRTPLGIISSSAGLLEDYWHKLDDYKKKKHFNQIQSSVKHMNHLLEDVLLIEQTDAGKLACKKSLVSIGNFCQEVVDDLTIDKQNENRVLLEIDLPNSSRDSDLKIYADPKLLRQILINLVSNALKYSPIDTQSRLKVIIHSDSITFQVSDRGIGIVERDKASLFESFSRGSNVSNIQGTGLGLSIVKRCVDLHGGSIDFTSEVNFGTTFIVNLPLDPPEYRRDLLDKLATTNS